MPVPNSEMAKAESPPRIAPPRRVSDTADSKERVNCKQKDTSGVTFRRRVSLYIQAVLRVWRASMQRAGGGMCGNQWETEKLGVGNPERLL